MSVRDIKRFEQAVDDLGHTYLDSYRAAVDHAFRVRECNARITHDFFTSHIALMEDHATLNERIASETLRTAAEYQEAFLTLAEEGLIESLPSEDEEFSRD